MRNSLLLAFFLFASAMFVGLKAQTPTGFNPNTYEPTYGPTEADSLQIVDAFYAAWQLIPTLDMSTGDTTFTLGGKAWEINSEIGNLLCQKNENLDKENYAYEYSYVHMQKVTVTIIVELENTSIPEPKPEWSDVQQRDSFSIPDPEPAESYTCPLYAKIDSLVGQKEEVYMGKIMPPSLVAMDSLYCSVGRTDGNTLSVRFSSESVEQIDFSLSPSCYVTSRGKEFPNDKIEQIYGLEIFNWLKTQLALRK